MKTKMIILLSCTLGLLITGRIALSEDLTDVDPAIEEILADSAAAKEEAQAAKKRGAEERIQNQQLRLQAQKTRVEAAAKRREAKAQLKSSDAEARKLLAEQVKIKRDLEKNEQDIAYTESSIKLSTAKLETVKRQTEALQTLRAEKLVRLAEVAKQRDQIARDVDGANQKLNTAHADFEKTRADEKVGNSKLSKAKADAAETQSRIELQVAKLREQFQANRAHLLVTEAETQKLEQKALRLEAEAKTAKSETENSEARLRVAKDKLHEARLRAEAKEFETHKQTVAADQRHNEIAVTESALNTTHESTELKTVVDRALTANAAPASPTLRLKRDCRIHEAPNLASKVNGVQLGGTAVVSHGRKKGWIGFSTDQGELGYISKSCF